MCSAMGFARVSRVLATGLLAGLSSTHICVQRLSCESFFIIETMILGLKGRYFVNLRLKVWVLKGIKWTNIKWTKGWDLGVDHWSRDSDSPR